MYADHQQIVRVVLSGFPAAALRPDMVGRDLEIDGELGERSVRAESLQPVHPWVELDRCEAAPNQRGGDTQGMRVEFRHGTDHSANGTAERAANRRAGSVVVEVAPAVNMLDQLGLAGEGVWIDRALMLTEKADDRGHVRHIDAEQICDRKMAAVVPVPPGEQEIGDAARLAIVGARDINQVAEGILDRSFPK